MRYLDGLRLARLRGLRLDLRRYRAEGYLSGRHRSSQHGFSQEFSQHREYAPGDELRTLDWKVIARKDRFFVKQFQEDKSLATYFLLDASGSMGFRSGGRDSKWDYACSLAMGMAYLVLEQGDAAGLVAYSARPRDMLPPRRSLGHLERMDRLLGGTVPDGAADLDAVLRRVLGDIHRRSLIIVLSDLLGDPAVLLKSLRALRARRHELLVAQVLDPAERDLPYGGMLLFEGMEGPESLRCDVESLRRAYREEFDREQLWRESHFRKASIGHMTAYTDGAWNLSLARFLQIANG
ncbi:MAG: DUF58 domain-containing protein [Elusimicrobia bacterium]|nr:DUF58 domain-containing protein [Elusimicrobiota bacterium]